MTIKYFNVKGGLTTGTITLDGTSGNVTIGNAALGNLVTANYFSGNGYLLSDLNGSNVLGQVGNALISGTVYTGAQPNITSVGTLTSLTITGNVSSGNANLGNLATATYFTGNGYLLAGITGANVDGNVTSAVQSHYANVANSVSGGNVTGQVANALVAGTVYTAAQPNITSVGTLSSLAVTANANVGNLNATGNVYATNFVGNVVGNISGNVTVTGNNQDVLFNDGGNIGATDGLKFDKTSNLVTVNGNIIVNNANLGNLATSNYFSGNGSLLTAITGANVTGYVPLATSANTAGTVTASAQPNITSTGTLSALTVTGNITSGNASVGNLTTTSTASFGANVNLNSYNINNLADPSVDQDAATKKYVDGLVSTGLYYHSPVVAATTTTLATTTGGTITYNNGTAGVDANLVTTGSFNLIDTANVQTLGTRILVKDEANATWNGIYTWVNSTTIKRSTDADSYGTGPGDLSQNDYFFVSGGSVNKGSGYVVSTTGTITFGTTNIDFSQFNTSQVYTAGPGLTLADLAFSVNNAQPNITSVGTLTSLTISGNVTSGNANLGNVAVANYFSGDGSLLTGVVSVTGSANYSNFAGTVTTAAQPNITSVGTLTTLTVSGNITSGNASLGNLATASYFSGNGSLLSSITGANVTGTVSSATSATTAGTVTTAAQPNITSTGTLNGLTGTGVIDFTGTSNVALGAVGNVHITGGSSGYLLSTDGSGTLSFIAPPSTTGITNGTSNISIPTVNGNVNTSVGGTANVLIVTTTGINVAGYVTATRFTGEGGNLSNIQGANVSGTVSSATTAGTVTASAQPNITSTGTLVSLDVTGNITSGNASLGNLVVASYFSGSGNLLANIQGSNVTGAVGSATTAGTVTTAAQPNITSVGTLTTLNVTGNIISGNVKLNGALTSNNANVVVTTSTIIDEFPTGSYRTAKYVISAKGTDGYQSAEVLLVQDGTNSFITIYGSVCSNNTADIVDFTSNIDGISGNARLYATTSSASTTVNLVKVYIPD